MRLVNTCGVGFALEMLLTGEAGSAQRALATNLVSKVVAHDELDAAEDTASRILRNDQTALESAKEPSSRSSAGLVLVTAKPALRTSELRYTSSVIEATMTQSNACTSVPPDARRDGHPEDGRGDH